MVKYLNLKKSEYWSESLAELNCSGGEIISKEFDGCVFTKCNFSEAVFNKSNFVDCEFINCNLSLVKIEYSKLSEVTFRESKLIGINWTKVA